MKFDIIRRGIFQSEVLEKLRKRASKLSDHAISEINEAIQDCTSEASIEQRLRDGIALYSEFIQPKTPTK